nr:MAG TPA: hypothetical protein [Caudoviricetes sp.]
MHSHPLFVVIILHNLLQSVQPVNRRIVERVRIVLVDVADVGVDVHGRIDNVFRFA